MRIRIRYLLIILVLLALSLGAVIFLGFPRLEKVTPADGAVDVSQAEPLRLVFSRAMDADSVRLAIEPATPGETHWEADNTLVFTPRSAWPSSGPVQVRLEPGARAAGFPNLPLRQNLGWSFTVWQPRLVYLYPADGPANLYVYEPQTGEKVYLTNAFNGVLDYDLQPDGKALYYSTPISQGGSEIVRLAIPPRQSSGAVSGAATPVGENTPTPTPVVLPQPQTVWRCELANCRALALSPRGDYLAFERTVLPGGEGFSQPQVWYLVLDPASGQAVKEPVLAGQPNHQTLQPLWSPDSRLTFYDSTDAAFHVLDPANGQSVRLANQTGQAGDWRPDGSAFLAPEIFFLDPGSSTSITGLERLADSHLLQYDPRSGQHQDLTQEEGIEDASPAFSPDGKYLAFARKYLDTDRWTPGRQLWLMDLQTNKARPLTADPVYNHYSFAWNRASDRLAFVRFNQSTLNEPPEVWAVDLVSGEFSKIMTGGYAPQWLP